MPRATGCNRRGRRNSFMEKFITRRDLLIAPLVVAVPMALLATAASAGGPDPTMTIVKRPEQLTWTRNPDFPEKSVEQAPLWSRDLGARGLPLPRQMASRLHERAALVRGGSLLRR